jgi:hypothetical protein
MSACLFVLCLFICLFGSSAQSPLIALFVTLCRVLVLAQRLLVVHLLFSQRAKRAEPHHSEANQNRQTGKQTNKPANKQTSKQTDKQTNKQKRKTQP